jgi:hypothetical protein
MNEKMAKSDSLFQKWTKKMSKIDFPKKLSNKKIQKIPSCLKTFFCYFSKILPIPLHYVDKTRNIVLRIINIIYLIYINYMNVCVVFLCNKAYFYDYLSRNNNSYIMLKSLNSYE